MSDTVMRISVLQKGYEVDCCDPKIQEANDKNQRYKDPWVSYTFTTKDQVVEFIESALDLVKPEPNKTFDAAFQEAVTDGADAEKE